MSAARQLPRALLAMGASMAVLTACSGIGASPALTSDECVGASPAEFTSGGSGELCADTGFQPADDGFSFANWGGTPTDDAIDSATLIAMFGREPVCANTAGDDCTVRPAAQSWMDQMNEALANGRCEGMAVLSERLFAGQAKATELDPRATRTIELARTQPAVARTLGYWWLTQFPAEVSAPTSQSRSLTPSQLVEQIVIGLRGQAGNTLGLYSEFGGHAVTPIAVVKENSNYTISVYDSNDPGVVKHVIIDPSTESWVYDAKSNSSGVVTERWTGTGAGSMDLTPMALRTGAFTAPFADTPGGDTYVTVTSPKDGTNLGAVITRGATVIDTRSLSARIPDNVIVHQITGTGAGVQVIIKGDAGEIDVRAVSSSPDAPATLSVDAPGKPMITARGRVGSDVKKTLTIKRTAGGAIAVESGSGAPARTTIATETETVRISATKTADVHVGSQPEPETSLVDQAGATLASYFPQSAAPASITATQLTLNTESNGFTVARSLTEATPIAPAPVIATDSASSPTPSASSTRERKEKSENERGRRSERPSKSRGDKPAEAHSTQSASPSASPSRTRTPEKTNDGGGSTDGGQLPDDKLRSPSSPAPTLVASASPSASVTTSASPSPSSSTSSSASAGATPAASATPSRSTAPTSTPTPAPSSTKKNDDKKSGKKDESTKKKNDEDEDD